MHLKEAGCMVLVVKVVQPHITILTACIHQTSFEKSV